MVRGSLGLSAPVTVGGDFNRTEGINLSSGAAGWFLAHMGRIESGRAPSPVARERPAAYHMEAMETPGTQTVINGTGGATAPNQGSRRAAVAAKAGGGGCCGGGCCGSSGCAAIVILLAALGIGAWLWWKSLGPIADVSLSDQAATKIRHKLGEFVQKGELRVGTREVDVEVVIDRESRVNVDLLGDWFDTQIPLGRTQTRVIVEGNKVQYMIPLTGTDAVRVQVLPEQSVVMLWLPRPQVDTEVVEVNSDPEATSVQVDKDWFHHLRWSDEREAAIAMLRDRVVAEASTPLAMDDATAKAVQSVQRMLEPVAREALGPKTEVVVRWADSGG